MGLIDKGAGVLLIPGAGLVEFPSENVAYTKTVTIGVVSINGYTISYTKTTTAVSVRSAASRLGLYSNVDVWSTPLVQWAEKQQFTRETTKPTIEVILNEREYENVQEEIKQLEQLIEKAKSDLKTQITATVKCVD